MPAMPTQSLVLSLKGRTYTVENSDNSETVELSRGRGDWSHSRAQEAIGVREKGGKYYVLLEQETSRATYYYEQRFDAETGRSEGRASRLDQADAYSKESAYGVDINGDGDVGEPTPTTVFGEGALTLDELSGRYIIQSDNTYTVLTADRGNAWDLPQGANVVGLRADGADFKILLAYTERGSTRFEELDISGGQVARQPAVLEGVDLAAAEVAYNTDFNGDTAIGDFVKARLDDSASGEYSAYQRHESADNGGVALVEMMTGALVIAAAEGIEDPESGDVVADTTLADLTAAVTLTDRGGLWDAGTGTAMAVRSTQEGYSVLIQGNLGWTEQSFDQTGVAVGRARSVDAKELVQLEVSYDQDLSGNGFVGDFATRQIGTSLRSDGNAPSLYLADSGSMFLFQNETNLSLGKTPIEATHARLTALFESDPDFADAVFDLLSPSIDSFRDAGLDSVLDSFGRDDWVIDSKEAHIAAKALDVALMSSMVIPMNSLEEGFDMAVDVREQLAAIENKETVAQDAFALADALLKETQEAVAIASNAFNEAQAIFENRLAEFLNSEKSLDQATMGNEKILLDIALAETTIEDATTALNQFLFQRAAAFMSGDTIAANQLDGQIVTTENLLAVTREDLDNFRAELDLLPDLTELQAIVVTLKAAMNEAQAEIAVADAALVAARNADDQAASDFQLALVNLESATRTAEEGRMALEAQLGDLDDIPDISAAQRDAFLEALSADFVNIPLGEGNLYTQSFAEEMGRYLGGRSDSLDAVTSILMTDLPPDQLVDGYPVSIFDGSVINEVTDAGNTIDTATVLDVGTSVVNGTITGDTDGTNDDRTGADMYKFTLEEDAVIRINMDSDDIDPEIFVLNSEGRMIGYNDDGPNSRNSELTLALTKGDYFVTAGDYDQALFASEEDFDASDPDDTFETYDEGESNITPDTPADIITPIVGWLRGPDDDDDEGDYTLTFTDMAARPQLLTDARSGTSWETAFGDNAEVVAARAVVDGGHAVLLQQQTAAMNDAIWYEQRFDEAGQTAGRLERVDVKDAEAAFVMDLDGDKLIDFTSVDFEDDYAVPLNGIALSGETVRMTFDQFEDLEVDAVTGFGSLVVAGDMSRVWVENDAVGEAIGIKLDAENDAIMVLKQQTSYIRYSPEDSFVDAIDDLDTGDKVLTKFGVLELIKGKEDDNLLVSEDGYNAMYGDDGEDTFVFNDTTNSVVIDFVRGEDKIEFDNERITFSDLSVSQQGDNTVITSGEFDGDITLLGISGFSEADMFFI